MSPALSPASAAEQPPRLERTRGRARLTVWADRGVTRLGEAYQSGSAKLRFPKTAHGAPLEAVLLNTAGGLTGGDNLGYSVAVDAGASGVATTQAAERIYRRADGVAVVETRLEVGAAASLAWLPQETIVFDRSAFRRTLMADVAETGRLVAVEAIVLGRTAMGERARSVAISDSWRISRGGKLVFADGLRVDGDSVSILSGGATGSGAIATATLVLVAPDAEASLGAARGSLSSTDCECGASAWNGVLVARLLANSGQTLRAGLIPLIETLRGETMPRVWHC